MPVFTLETTHRLPIFRHRNIEAPTLEEACRLAIKNDDWSGERDYETAGATSRSPRISTRSSSARRIISMSWRRSSNISLSPWDCQRRISSIG
jgi:hypothetical protein